MEIIEITSPETQTPRRSKKPTNLMQTIIGRLRQARYEDERKLILRRRIPRVGYFK